MLLVLEFARSHCEHLYLHHVPVRAQQSQDIHDSMQCPKESFDPFRVRLGRPYDSVITARDQVVHVVTPNAAGSNRPQFVSSHQRHAQLTTLPPRDAHATMPPPMRSGGSYPFLRRPNLGQVTNVLPQSVHPLTRCIPIPSARRRRRRRTSHFLHVVVPFSQHLGADFVG